MKRGWLKNTFYRYFYSSTCSTPQDNIRYYISEDVVRFSEIILREYGNVNPPNEGFVYWAGKKDFNKIFINTVIAPRTESNWGSVVVSHESNVDLVLCLSENKLIHVGQVHSHPGDWVDHSAGDDSMAPFKMEGLLSFVVRQYGLKGINPLTECGVHRYDNRRFIRLSKKYIKTHFRIINIEAKLFDFRIKKQ